MFCPACGNKIPDNSKKCEHCGEEVASQAAPSTPPQGPQTGGGGASNQPGGNFDPVALMKKSWGIIQSDISNVFVYSLIYTIVEYVCAIVFPVVPGILAGNLLVVRDYLRKQGKLEPGQMIQRGWPYWGNMLVFWIVASIISTIGFFCFIVPGLALSMAFLIASFAIVDKNATFSEAFNMAIELVSKQFVGLMIIGLLLLALIVLSAIFALILPCLGWMASFVASILVMPVLVFTAYFAYEELLGGKQTG